LNAGKELKEIFFQTKRLITAYEEVGLDPPMLPRNALDFPDSAMLKKTTSPTLERSDPREETARELPEKKPLPPQFGSLEALRTYIGDCQRCGLHKERNNLVFGEGNPDAKLVFVGEGPGFDEDREGRPFVGKSGQLLTRIIENGMGLTRDAVYICNVVKCRPPGNRDPKPDEVTVCLPFLKSQLDIIKPRVICCLGRVACQALFGTDFKITGKRGKWQTYEGIPLMPTFHPAYLLRNDAAKRPVWEDMKKIMQKLGLEVKP